jgi:hypothetical protein
VIDAGIIEEAERRWLELQGDGSRVVDGSALEAMQIDEGAFYAMAQRAVEDLPDRNEYLSGIAYGFVRGVIAARLESADSQEDG